MPATHRLTSLTVLSVVFALTPNLTARQTAAAIGLSGWQSGALGRLSRVNPILLTA